jgi:hypothetical protein
MCASIIKKVGAEKIIYVSVSSCDARFALFEALVTAGTVYTR